MRSLARRARGGYLETAVVEVAVECKEMKHMVAKACMPTLRISLATWDLPGAPSAGGRPKCNLSVT